MKTIQIPARSRRPDAANGTLTGHTSDSTARIAVNMGDNIADRLPPSATAALALTAWALIGMLVWAACRIGGVL